MLLDYSTETNRHNRGRHATLSSSVVAMTLGCKLRRDDTTAQFSFETGRTDTASDGLCQFLPQP
jgi:hypothetical protein